MSKEYPEFDRESGRWFRWFAPNCREFEPDLNFCGKPERIEHVKEEPPTLYCPLRAHRPRCSPHCAIYSGNGCKVAEEPANNGTRGKKCPFDGTKCNSSCAMYNDGCGAIRVLEKGIKK